MKSIAILLFLIAPFCQIDAQLPSNGLIAYYDFNMDTNRDTTMIYDQSGNGNHGGILGEMRYVEDRFKIGCSALHFDGNSYVSIPGSPTLNSPRDEITISVWFNINHGAHLFDQWITICCKSNLSMETVYSPQYRMQATAQTVSLNTEFTEEMTPQLEYDTWYFYAYIFDGYKVKVYLNGRYIFEYPYYGELRGNDLPLEIGRDLPGKPEYFYGRLDDLRIYDRALSERELSQVFKDISGMNDDDRCHKVPRPRVIIADISRIPIECFSMPRDREAIPMPKIEPYIVIDAIPHVDTFPEEIAGIPIKYQDQPVKINSKFVTVYPYDNGVEDGDTVSININGKWVIKKYRIQNKTYNISERPALKIEMNPDGPNYLISKAWNEGLIKPNTLTVEISDGVRSQVITINSEVGESGAIRIEVGR